MSGAAPQAQLTPHGAARVDFDAGGARLAALRAAADPAADLRATALLLPGYTGSKEDFAPLLDPLAAAGFDVVAVDLPGQYESPGPDREDDALPAPLGRVVAALAGDLAGDGRRVLLLGHSYGGLVARAAVLAGAPVAGLVLLGSGPAALPDEGRRAALDAGEALLRAEGLEAAHRVREAQDAARPGSRIAAAPPAVRELLRTRFLRTSPVSLLGMAAALRGEPDRTAELRAALRATSTPCLVVCGADDDAWPVTTQRAMAQRLDADFAVVPGAAHSPAVEHPAGLLATLLPTWRSWLAG